MKAFLVLALAVGILVGCANVNYQAFEGADAVRQGTGGTRVVERGVDFWTYGSPPRKYKILGVLSGEMSGTGAEGFIRGAIADEARKRGGDAVMPIDTSVNEKGALYLGTGAVGTTQVKQMRYTLLKYLD
jgi:hypothetical protein